MTHPLPTYCLQDLTQASSLKGLASKVPVLSPVIAHVEGVKALGEALHIGGADSLQEVNVVLRVEAAHVMLRGLVRLEDLRIETQGEPRQGRSQSRG